MRSLKASPQGIQKAKAALTDKQLKQEDLIGSDTCESRSTISKFFNGKPVKDAIFVGICNRLGLDWQEIVDSPPSPKPELEEQDDNFDINVLVKEVRDKICHTYKNAAVQCESWICPIR